MATPGQSRLRACSQRIAFGRGVAIFFAGPMTDPFVDHLASLCVEHVTRTKWVFVRTHAVGGTIGEHVALDGTNWLNLRFVTPQDRTRSTSLTTGEETRPSSTRRP